MIGLMVAVPTILSSTYVAALMVGLVLSFAMREKPHRRAARIATALLATPALMVIALFVGASILFPESPPPTLSDLERGFQSKRGDLETILRMSDEDVTFSRIAPDFIDQVTGKPNESRSFHLGGPHPGLTQLRWDSYRVIFARNNIKLGIERNVSRDAFIMVDSIGLLNRGHTSGYVYCAPDATGSGHRYYPCEVRLERDHRTYDPETRATGYSFKKLVDCWYAYEEGHL